MQFTELDPQHVVATIERLYRRIEERFPTSGLGRAVGVLHEKAQRCVERVIWIRRPILWLRAVIALLLVGLPIPLVLKLMQVRDDLAETPLSEFLQTLEAAIASTIFLGAAIAFLVSIERRIKRGRTLAAIHELRVLAHIVDMHQLTKDPESLLPGRVDTPSSPVRTMTPYELGRYLDYCSEALSLIAKLAAVYAQDLVDGIALDAVEDVEGLTSSLSSKVWQKIMLLDQIQARRGSAG